jgi:hypothetical protein
MHAVPVTINAKHVRIHQLVDPVEARPGGAWVFEHHGQAFLTDAGGGNPEPFSWGDQARLPIESRARAREPATGFDVMSREDIARALRSNPALLSFVEHGEPGFPRPILEFRDGPIWDAEAVERWIPTRQPQDGRRTSVPRT